MQVTLIAAPVDKARFYTAAEYRCWRLLDALRYQWHFSSFMTPQEYMMLYAVRQEHYGLLSLASILRDNGHDVRYATPDTVDTVDRSLFAADLVGISCLTATFPNALQIASDAKSHNSDTCVMLGGHHAHYFSQLLLQEEACIDIIVEGFAEARILPIVESLHDKRRLDLLQRIPGIAYRHTRDNSVFVTDSPPLPPLRGLPPPAFDLVSRPLVGARIYSSYTCPFSCRFCPVRHQSSVAPKDFSQLRSELRYLTKHHPIKLVYWGDPVLGNDLTHVAHIARLMHEFGLHWQFQTRLEFLTAQLLTLLKDDPTCVGIELGIETTHGALLHAAGKRIAWRQAQEIMDSVRALPMNLLTYWIAGLPGAMRRSLAQDFAAMQALLTKNILVHCNMLVPYPGTEYFRHSAAHGIQIHTYDWRQYYSGGTPVHSLVNPPLSAADLAQALDDGQEMLANTAAALLDAGIAEQFNDTCNVGYMRGIF